jgi:hypothetical protein
MSDHLVGHPEPTGVVEMLAIPIPREVWVVDVGLIERPSVRVAVAPSAEGPLFPTPPKHSEDLLRPNDAPDQRIPQIGWKSFGKAGT